MKYELIQKNRSKYPVKKMCKILEVSKSGFYKWLKRQPKKNNKLSLLTEIKAIHKKNRGTYGYPRITKVLKGMSYVVNKKKVARLMRENGIFGLQIKRFRPKTTISTHNYPISPNLVNRNFRVKRKK